MLVGEDDDVVLENDQEVADFLAILVVPSLISEGIRMTPERQKCAVAQLS